MRKSNDSTGFTIVELLIVIVVIAILAAITIVSYNGVIRQTTETSLKSDLRNASTQLNTMKIEDGAYPSGSLPGTITASGDNSLSYSSGGTTFCLTATPANSAISSYYITHEGTIDEGICPVFIQTITAGSCPDERTLVIDARDSRTYWIQELADGNCWMLTNLAYAGGGNDTYSDTRTLTDGTGGASTYTAAHYYVPDSGSNATDAPASPSTSTDGTGQYGYLYNWCGALGGQSTAACAGSTTPAPDPTISVCPAGWHLPANAEFDALIAGVNGGTTGNDNGLRADWFAQRAGYWFGSMVDEGARGRYWSSNQATAYTSHSLNIQPTYIDSDVAVNKRHGNAVRCIAN